jgi:hypothetical protein
MSPTPLFLPVAGPTTDVPVPNLKASPDSLQNAINEVPTYAGGNSRADDDSGGDDTRRDTRDDDDDADDFDDYGADTPGDDDAGGHGVDLWDAEIDNYMNDGLDQDIAAGGSKGRVKTRNGDPDGSGKAKRTGIKIKLTNKRNSTGVKNLVPQYDEDYDEDDDAMLDYEEDDLREDGDSAGQTPVADVKAEGKGKGKGKAQDKRAFGGSSKGRKCHRWTRKQEMAAVKGMIEIRAEGEILGDLCFQELYNRLIARDPTWNHSVSGIHNAWHRRELVKEVVRAETITRRKKEIAQARLDKQLGLEFKDKPTLKRKAATKPSGVLAKTEHGASPDGEGNEDEGETSDEESLFVGKRRRYNPSTPLTQPNLARHNTASSRTLSAFNIFPSPATIPDPVFDFPTVTISFKPHHNNTRRTRDFSYVDTMNRFWNQVVATPMFEDLANAFLVVLIRIGDSEKTYNMAQHDKPDYANFVNVVARAVVAAGNEPVVVHVTPAV